jgi:hypothetical protein
MTKKTITTCWECPFLDRVHAGHGFFDCTEIQDFTKRRMGDSSNQMGKGIQGKELPYEDIWEDCPHLGKPVLFQIGES